MPVAKNVLARSYRGKFAKGFSLIEVVIAIGVVSFAVLSVVGLFGGIMQTAGNNTNRRELANGYGSLRYFLENQGFPRAFAWAGGGQELMYVTYRSDNNGDPSEDSDVIAARWLNPDEDDPTSFESARVGRWIKAKLAVSPSNPGGTSVGSLENYKSGFLLVVADIDVVAIPEQPMPDPPAVRLTINLSR